MLQALKHRLSAALMAGVALMVVVGPQGAAACSICRCGDPAFNALGLNLYETGSWRFALDWDRFDKSQRSAEADGGGESVVEQRTTATVSYTPADRLTLVVRVPYTSRRLTNEPASVAARALHGEQDHGGSTTGQGLSDPEIYGLVRLWAAPFEPGLGRRAWIGLQLGVKTPWGENDLSENGERLDEHVQPGTGSTDWTAGLAAVYAFDASSSLFGSMQHRRTGSNDHGYRYGASTLANLGVERKLGAHLDAVLELNGRHTVRDRMNAGGDTDPNTGGRLLYLSPKLVVDLSYALAARFSAQVPVAKRLNGDQTERTVWSVGLTYVPGI